MTIWEFMGKHPILTFFLAWLIAEAACWPFKLANRWIRHRNILAHGWPPAHCDADGDLVKRKEEV